MKIIFLDIDGVLNAPHDHKGGWINQDLCLLLNEVLKCDPNIKIVLSSAWLYYILEGDMTLRGFEAMLCACGLNAYGRLINHIGESTLKDRTRGILDEAKVWNQHLTRWVAIDDWDLNLPEENYVKTINGLTPAHIKEIKKKLDLK